MNAATLIESTPLSRIELAGPSRELQQLWFAVARGEWASLALTPAGGAVDALALAASLCEMSYLTAAETPLALLDGTGATLQQAAALLRELRQRVRRGERVLLAVDPPGENPAALSLAASCDAALLCVALGQSDLDSAREAIDRCGRERFLGVVAMRP